MKPAAVVLASVLFAPAWLAAQTTVDETRKAAPDGSVSIENMAGSVKVTGWDKAEVQVRGTIGDGGELSLEGTGKRIHIEIEADHNPMGDQERPRGVRAFRQLASTIEGFQATISVTGVTGLGDGRDGQRVDRAVGRRQARRAAERQRRDRRDGRDGPREGRGRQRQRRGARRLRGPRGLDGERQAARDRRTPTTAPSSSRWRAAVRFEAALSGRATLSIETVSAPVELLLPASIAAEFSVSSFSGRITNELGPAAEKRGKWTPQTELASRPARAARAITVETLSGSIAIRKRP